MMKQVFGVWNLDNPIPCKKELSGEIIKSTIANTDIFFLFPKCPEHYIPNANSLKTGDLSSPIEPIKNINWGMINAWPEGLLSITAIGIYANVSDEQVAETYAAFPAWKEKFYDLNWIKQGCHIIPEQKMPSFLTTGGIYDGLELCSLIDISGGKTLKHEINRRSLEPISLQFLDSQQCYDVSQMTELLANTGSTKPLRLVYELLKTSYQAFYRRDFRSAVIISGSALEKSILEKMQKHYIDNSLTSFEKAKNNHKMLGPKFRWLKEENISCPISNYKTTILDLRNAVTHEGHLPSEESARECLKNCTKIIQEYSTRLLED